MSAPEHKSLAEALRAFQAEVPTLPKDATNPHFRSKFTPLDTMVEVTRPLLAKHGLAWSALPCFGPNGEPALRYQLLHAGSGESQSDVMPLLVTKSDPQGMGSALTYARRYSLAAMLNLVADEDDDGNSASPRNGQVAPQGVEADADLKARIGPALKKILGDDLDYAKDTYKKILGDLGVGYMPGAAAQALVTVAEALPELPWTSALPEVE